MNPNDPAFPNGPIHMMNMEGLTKRELFAAMAMQGILANSKNDWKLEEQAVRQADALIAELSK